MLSQALKSNFSAISRTNSMFFRGNTVANRFKNFTEIIYYKESFLYKKGDSGKNIARQRKFVYNENGELVKAINNVRYNDLLVSYEKSSKRAKDNFYGYALSNEWKYFITLTVNPNKYGKNDIERKRYLANALKVIKYYDSAAKYLGVSERHHNSRYGGENNNTLHFHFLASFEIVEALTPAINQKTNELIYSKSGSQVYNFAEKYWKYGFSTIVPIGADKDSQESVISYLCKYMIKCQDFQYNARRFYRSRNLAFKEKSVLFVEHSEFIDMMDSLFVKFIKENSNVIVYRIYADNYAQIMTELQSKSLGLNLLKFSKQRKSFLKSYRKEQSKRRFLTYSQYKANQIYKSHSEELLVLSKDELDYLDTIF